MSSLQHSALLDFLKKPRYVNDVAQKFGISPRLAEFSLRKAVKSDQVLVSDRRFRLKNREDSFKVAGAAGYLHISRESPLLHSGSTPSRGSLAGVKFLQKNVNLYRKGHTESKNSIRNLSSKSVNHLTGHLSRRSKQRQDTPEAEIWWRKPKPRGGKPPSHHTLQSLYDELLNRSLTLVEIANRFDLSKQSVKRLIRRGLLEEEWGESGIGVRYRLSETGGRRLSAMQTASRVSAHGKQVFIQLKSRSPV